MRPVSVRVICKTSDPIFTEGKDLHGNMPAMPRTDSMFDRKEKPKPAAKPDNDSMINGQRHTGHASSKGPRVTQPGSTVRDGLTNVHIYFDGPGDFQRQ